MKFKLLGEYKVGKTIGEGAFSKVKVATHSETGEKVFGHLIKVAIKIINKKKMQEVAAKSRKNYEDRERRRLIAERKRAHLEEMRRRRVEEESNDDGEAPGPIDFAKLIEDLQKVNDELQKVEIPAEAPKMDNLPTIQTFEIYDSPEESLVIMELAKGGELMDYVTTHGRLNEKEGRKYFRQIVSAMIHCHQANIVHRDLKLENILLNQNKECLISDFGLGRTFDENDMMKTFCGTPNYASVELVSGIPYDGVKSDIWALGVILYILIAGKRPFHGSSLTALYQRIVNVDYETPIHFSDDLLSKIFVANPAKRISMEGIRAHPWINIGYNELVELYPPKIIEDSSLGQSISSVHNDSEYTVYTLKPTFKRKKSNIGTEDSLMRRRSSVGAKGLERRNSHVQTMTPGGPMIVSQSIKSFNDTFTPIPFHRRASSFFEYSFSYLKKSRTESTSVFDSSSPVEKRTSIDYSRPITPELKQDIQDDEEIIKAATDAAQLFGSSTEVQTPFNRVQTRRRKSSVKASIQEERSETIESAGQNHIDNYLSEATRADPIEENSVPIRRKNSIPVSIQRRRSSLSFRRASLQTNSGAYIQSNEIKHSDSPIVQSINLTSSDYHSSDQNSLSKEVEKNSSLFSSYMEDGGSKIIQDSKDGHLNRTTYSNPLELIKASNPSIKRRGRSASVTIGQKQSPSKQEKVFQIWDEDSIAPLAAETIQNQNQILSQVLVERPIPSIDEIAKWHETLKPPKTIRTVRTPFSKGLYSFTLEPAKIFVDLHEVLKKIAKTEEESFILTFKRQPEFYLFNCEVVYKDGRDFLKFEAEVNKLWMLNLHGIRIKKVSGDGFDFKNLYSQIIDEIRYKN